MFRSADPGNELVQLRGTRAGQSAWNKIDLQQGDILIYIMDHEDNEHCMMASRR